MRVEYPVDGDGRRRGVDVRGGRGRGGRRAGQRQRARPRRRLGAGRRARVLRRPALRRLHQHEVVLARPGRV